MDHGMSIESLGTPGSGSHRSLREKSVFARDFVGWKKRKNPQANWRPTCPSSSAHWTLSYGSLLNPTNPRSSLETQGPLKRITEVLHQPNPLNGGESWRNCIKDVPHRRNKPGRWSAGTSAQSFRSSLRPWAHRGFLTKVGVTGKSGRPLVFFLFTVETFKKKALLLWKATTAISPHSRKLRHCFCYS